MQKNLSRMAVWGALFLALGSAGASPAWSAEGRETSLEQDRLAIENVAQDYVRALDGADLTAYLATLTDDAKFLSKEGNYFGKQAIADYVRPVMESRLAQMREGTQVNKGTHHVVTNVAISFLGEDQAIMRSYWMFAVTRKAGGIELSLMGSAEDHFVKRNGKWLISERHVETL